MKNRVFVKFMKASENELITLAASDQSAFVIFMILVKYMDDSGALIISNIALSRITKKSVRTIGRGILFLKKHKYIKVAKTGTSNIYYINSCVANVDGIGRDKMASFSCAVVICDTEIDLSKNLSGMRIKKVKNNNHAYIKGLGIVNTETGETKPLS